MGIESQGQIHMQGPAALPGVHPRIPKGLHQLRIPLIPIPLPSQRGRTPPASGPPSLTPSSLPPGQFYSNGGHSNSGGGGGGGSSGYGGSYYQGGDGYTAPAPPKHGGGGGGKKQQHSGGGQKTSYGSGYSSHQGQQPYGQGQYGGYGPGQGKQKGYGHGQGGYSYSNSYNSPGGGSDYNYESKYSECRERGERVGGGFDPKGVLGRVPIPVTPLCSGGSSCPSQELGMKGGVDTIF